MVEDQCNPTVGEVALVAGPSVFIGSSSEGLDVAHYFHAALQKKIPCEPTVWDQGVFGAGSGTMDSLVQEATRVDFAVLVATADDLTESRGQSQAAPRDNVMFELGLFMGALGLRRVFILPEEGPLKLPSDLAGITRLSAFATNRRDANLRAALSPAVLDATDAIKLLGPRDTAMAPAPSSTRGRSVDGAAVGPTGGDDAQMLEAELRMIFHSAKAQGWKIGRTETTVRLTSPAGKRHTLTLPRNPSEGRARLRIYANELRAHGLRVNQRVRTHP